MKKKILMIAGAILTAAALAAGGFYGGMAYQSNQAKQAQANFANGRGGQFANGQLASGQAPTGAQVPGGFPGGGTTGQIKSITGNVMTVSTAQNVTTVNLSDTTQVQKSAEATAAELQPGVQVRVIGPRDSSGNITASQIQILNNDTASAKVPAATGTAP